MILLVFGHTDRGEALMIGTDKTILMPVQKSTSGDGLVTLVQIESLREMEDWGEVVEGPLSPEALSVMEQFFGVKPNITSLIVKSDSEIPNTYEFPVPGMARGTDLSFRIWQYGVGNGGHAEIDICAKGGSPVVSGLYCTPQKITWVGIGHSQLLVATEYGALYRVIRQCSTTQNWRRLFWHFSKVMGFWIEMRSIQDRSNGFARYVPAHLR